MSVTTENTDTPVTDTPQARAPKASKRAASPRASRTTFNRDASLSQVVNAVAQARRIDATKAGKLVRSHLRSNFDNYASGRGNTPKWGALAKSKSNKDGNRYPAMPPSVANAIVTRMTAKA